MGSNAFHREERPARFESVDGYWIDRYPVTNAEFRCFVDATGFITFSERVPLAEMYPDATPELLVPGSLVFVKPRHPVSLGRHRPGGHMSPAQIGVSRTGLTVRSP